jgi:hypothetical protein
VDRQWWAKDAKLGLSTINAKAETVASKPAFRDAFRERRCLAIADGFYERKKLGAKTKQPYLIQVRDHEPFAFAGHWERWRDRAHDVVLETTTIITTEPNELCAPIHNRMPASRDVVSLRPHQQLMFVVRTSDMASEADVPNLSPNVAEVPRRDSCAAQISRRIMVPTSMALTCSGGAVRSINSEHWQFSFSAARR